MLIKLVDENNGKLEVNSSCIKKVFNDENDIVKVESQNGEVALAADQDYDTLNDAVLTWKENHPDKFANILDNM